MWTQAILFVYAPVQTIFAYRKINKAWVIKFNVCWKRVPKGRASGCKIDPEILPYLTGAINSIMMFNYCWSYREDKERSDCMLNLLFLPTQMCPAFHPSIQCPPLPDFSPVARCIFKILHPNSSVHITLLPNAIYQILSLYEVVYSSWPWQVWCTKVQTK